MPRQTSAKPATPDTTSATGTTAPDATSAPSPASAPAPAPTCPGGFSPADYGRVKVAIGSLDANPLADKIQNAYASGTDTINRDYSSMDGTGQSLWNAVIRASSSSYSADEITAIIVRALASAAMSGHVKRSTGAALAAHADHQGRSTRIAVDGSKVKATPAKHARKPTL